MYVYTTNAKKKLYLYIRNNFTPQIKGIHGVTYLVGNIIVKDRSFDCGIYLITVIMYVAKDKFVIMGFSFKHTFNIITKIQN